MYQTINLNESSQLFSQQDRTAKALPLVWASKLAARVHDYYYDTFKLEAGDLSRNFKVEDDHNVVAAGAKMSVLKTLGLNDGPSVGNPWHQDLNNKMFYL